MDSATNIDYEDERLDVGSVVLLTSLQKCMVRRMSYKMETTVRNEGESEGENGKWKWKPHSLAEDKQREEPVTQDEKEKTEQVTQGYNINIGQG